MRYRLCGCFVVVVALNVTASLTTEVKPPFPQKTVVAPAALHRVQVPGTVPISPNLPAHGGPPPASHPPVPQVLSKPPAQVHAHGKHKIDLPGKKEDVKVISNINVGKNQQNVFQEIGSLLGVNPPKGKQHKDQPVFLAMLDIPPPHHKYRPHHNWRDMYPYHKHLKNTPKGKKDSICAHPRLMKLVEKEFQPLLKSLGPGATLSDLEAFLETQSALEKFNNSLGGGMLNFGNEESGGDNFRMREASGWAPQREPQVEFVREFQW
jgi:hypothetical protein